MSDTRRTILYAFLAWNLLAAWVDFLDWVGRGRLRWHLQTMWMYFIYQIVSGYPPGELTHWYAPASPDNPETGDTR